MGRFCASYICPLPESWVGVGVLLLLISVRHGYALALPAYIAGGFLLRQCCCARTDLMFNGWMVAARRQTVQVLLACAAVVASGPVQSHGTTVGALQIEHPYAVPTGAGQTEGAVYFRAIRNNGAEPDRLIGAETPVAQAVRLQGDAQQRGAIVLPANSARVLRHTGCFVAVAGLAASIVRGRALCLDLAF